ncbi:DUF1120 domain-containing protein [Pseudomonas sp. AL03]|uniref:DUF1120 domain-containing protein n=1 Tax=Pseudomonas sp. AL03 TaxID=3042230 RepID=UPI00249A7BCD|nr:DUF1120 domain-containing protein [Pseudomonas sp. AL03]MDI3270806.1 DUF1120 domain-containing protein [Pseudomonas sp. AL03]
MNSPKKALLGSLLALSATSAFAVDTADLRVIGTIAPTACTPTFGSGATVDYGNIPTASLSATNLTLLAAHTIAYTISCDAPISIATSWSDNRAGTAYLGAVDAFGLGLQDAAKIGYYRITQIVGGATADGAPVDIIQKNNAASAWVLSTDPRQTNDGVRMYSYAPTGTLVPGSYTNFSGVLSVVARIAPTSTLDLSSSITLDGLSTISVRYL